MPRGDKSSYSNKQKRMAEHIEDSEKKRGASSKTAARIGWATVNKETGGAAKKKSGTKKASAKTESSSTSQSSSSAKRSAAAKKGWATRRKKAA